MQRIGKRFGCIDRQVQGFIILEKVGDIADLRRQQQHARRSHLNYLRRKRGVSKVAGAQFETKANMSASERIPVCNA